MLEFVLIATIAGTLAVLQRLVVVLRRQNEIESKIDAIYGLLGAVMEGVSLTADNGITQSKLLQEMTLVNLRKQ